MTGPSTGSILNLVPSAGQEFCTGVHVENNIFQHNFGCFARSGGVVRVECVDYNSQSDAIDNIFMPDLPLSTA